MQEGKKLEKCHGGLPRCQGREKTQQYRVDVACLNGKSWGCCFWSSQKEWPETNANGDLWKRSDSGLQLEDSGLLDWWFKKGIRGKKKHVTVIMMIKVIMI